MAVESIVIWLVVGAVTGLLSSVIMKGKGLAFTGNELVDDIVLGIIGASVGGFVLSALGVSIGTGMIGSIIHAVIGACIFIFAIRLIRR